VRRTPPERRNTSLNVTRLVLADASRSAAGHIAAVNGPACRIYRELSNSHELSMMHPTRLSLSMNGATPQAAPGYRKLVEWCTSQVCVYELSRECPPCGGAERARWLRSPPHTRASRNAFNVSRSYASRRVASAATRLRSSPRVQVDDLAPQQRQPSVQHAQDGVVLLVRSRRSLGGQRRSY
jgi:hypothetical protein